LHASICASSQADVTTNAARFCLHQLGFECSREVLDCEL